MSAYPRMHADDLAQLVHDLEAEDTERALISYDPETGLSRDTTVEELEADMHRFPHHNHHISGDALAEFVRTIRAAEQTQEEAAA